MQSAGYKAKVEKWDSDSDSDETDEEDLKVGGVYVRTNKALAMGRRFVGLASPRGTRCVTSTKPHVSLNAVNNAGCRVSVNAMHFAFPL